MNKYKLTDETKELDGHILYRIEALVDLYDMKKGDKGGWIEKESNLSQAGDCWVYANAVVYDNAKVCGDAVVGNNAKVCGDAVVGNNAKVCDDAVVLDNAKVCDDAVVLDNARVCGDAWVSGDALVRGNALVCDNAKVYGNAVVSDNAKVSGYARVIDNAVVSGNAVVRGNAEVSGYAEICGDAIIEKMGDYLVFQNWWSSGRFFTYTKSNKMWKVGCFYGTGEELIKKAYVDSEDKGKMYEEYVNFVNRLIK